MAAKLIVAVIVIPFDRCILDCPVHSLDLAIGPWVIWLGQPMLNPIRLADQIKPHLAERDSVPVPWLLCELNAVVGQDRVELIWYRFKQVFQELPGGLAVGLLDQLGDGELAGAVNGDKEIKLSFLGSDLGNIDVEITNRVALKLLALGFVAFDVRQTGYSVSLKTAMH